MQLTSHSILSALLLASCSVASAFVVTSNGVSHHRGGVFIQLPPNHQRVASFQVTKLKSTIVGNNNGYERHWLTDLPQRQKVVPRTRRRVPTAVIALLRRVVAPHLRPTTVPGVEQMHQAYQKLLQMQKPRLQQKKIPKLRMVTPALGNEQRFPIRPV